MPVLKGLNSADFWKEHTISQILQPVHRSGLTLNILCILIPLSGGKILRDIRIAGSGKIENDIECLTLHSSGSIKIYGNLITHGDIKASGSFVCEGKVFAGGDINCSGTIKIEQSVVSKGKISLSGSIKGTSFVNSSPVSLPKE